MRLKHIKDAETLIFNSEYVVKNPFENKGNWNKVFGNSNPINLEIGMGKGDFLISLAIDNPNINYIGIEKYASVILSTIKKLNDLKIDNLIPAVK